MNIRHKIKKALLKTSIWIKRTFLPGYAKFKEINANQRKAISICISIINNPTSELLMSKLSDKRYIKNGDYFIIIEENNIRIVNHVYCYDVPVHGHKIENLKDLFDNRINAIQLEMENEIMKNVKNSLEIVLHNIKNIK
jgi:hypothetical protein